MTRFFLFFAFLVNTVFTLISNGIAVVFTDTFLICCSVNCYEELEMHVSNVLLIYFMLKAVKQQNEINSLNCKGDSML